MKAVYPVIFTDVDTNILIEVPDLGILTEANEEGKKKGTVADAIVKPRDENGLTCINLQDENKEIPEPTALSDLDVNKGTFAQDGEGVISLVDVDLTVYRRVVDNKMVRRNVTLPNWLNREAEEAHLNVSAVLREALMSTLGVPKA